MAKVETAKQAMAKKKTGMAASETEAGNALAEQVRAYQRSGSDPFSWTYASVDDRDRVTLIGKVRDGIPFNEFRKIRRQIDFSMDEWATFLQVSVRTLQRNEKEDKAFLPVQSERIMELTMLHNYGLEVFGDKDKFSRWLSARSVALGGVAPKELLDTNFGIQMVKDAIARIEHGVLA